jgi:membrane protease YdiL (CAAX protease family)
LKKLRNDSEVLRKSLIPSLRSGKALHPFASLREGVSALSTQHSTLVILAYAGLIFLAEVTCVLAGAYYGTWIHALLVPALLNHYMIATRAPYRRILPVLALLPLLRILSLVMPAEQLPELYWYLLVGAPLLFAAVLTARLLKLSGARLGLRPRIWPPQVAIALTGLPLGLAGFLLILPQPIIETLNRRDVALGIVILLLYTGFAEEFIFRGLLQSVATETLGRAAIYFSTALFTTMYLGTFSPRFILFTGLVGLYFGWCANRTRSIWGVAFAHGVLNIAMLLFLPFAAGAVNSDLIAGLSAATQLALWLVSVVVTGFLLVAFLRHLRSPIVVYPDLPALRNPYDTQPLALQPPREADAPADQPRSGWLPLVALLVLWLLLGLGLCALGLSRGDPLSNQGGQPATGPSPSPTRSVTPRPLPSPTLTPVSSLPAPFPAPGADIMQSRKSAPSTLRRPLGPRIRY